MKVLMSAYACCPDMGSEPGVGWNWALQMSRWHEVWVITKANNREPIEAELARQPRPNLHFSYVDLPGRASWWWRLGKPLGWLRYYLWQWLALREARRLHAEVHFDLAHHVTFASWRAPSFLWKLGVPFVWGPVGGGQSAPKGFFGSLGMRAWLGEVLRQAFQCLNRWDPLLKSAMRRATLVLSANSATARFLTAAFGIRVAMMLETGIRVERYSEAAAREGPIREAFNILWVGSLVPLKNLPLLLRASVVLREKLTFRITVIGGGPERRRWESILKSMGLIEQVHFIGRLPYEETQRRYRDADLFVFTSLRDTSGNVLLEAMAARLPVICLNCGGPADMITEECGIKIEPRSEAYVVEKLAEAIERLARDPELRRRMGEAGRKRAEAEFSWEVLGKRMKAFYHEVAGK